jgi:hypothetical protein
LAKMVRAERSSMGEGVRGRGGVDFVQALPPAGGIKRKKRRNDGRDRPSREKSATWARNHAPCPPPALVSSVRVSIVSCVGVVCWPCVRLCVFCVLVCSLYVLTYILGSRCCHIIGGFWLSYCPGTRDRETIDGKSK